MTIYNHKNTLTCLYVIILSIIITSCNCNNKQDFTSIVNDTLITYDMDGISTEGTVSKVNYINGKINRSVTNIYAGTWQDSIIYEFQNDKIKVLEIKYSYKTELENIKSLEDMQIEYNIDYFIDYKGNIIGEEIPNRIDIFKEFRETVPFKLR